MNSTLKHIAWTAAAQYLETGIEADLLSLPGWLDEADYERVKNYLRSTVLKDVRHKVSAGLATSKKSPPPEPKPFRLSNNDKMSDADFLKWAQSYKPCKRCKKKFYGPVCECETGS